MLKEELYQQYLQWKKEKIAWSIEEIFGFPKVDCDVYENEDVLVGAPSVRRVPRGGSCISV